MLSSGRRTIYKTLKINSLVGSESDGDEPERFEVFVLRRERQPCLAFGMILSLL